MDKRLMIASCVAAGLLGSPAWADFDKGLEAYRAKDFDMAFAEFEESAREGHDTSQFNLGVMYFRGEGVERDLVRAFSWIDLATQGGDSDYIAAEEVLIMMLSSDQIRAGQVIAQELAKQHGLSYTPLDLAGMGSRLTVMDGNP